MKHLVGSVIRILIDYMDYVPLCAKLKSALEAQREWPEIRRILGKKKILPTKILMKNVYWGSFLLTSLILFQCYLFSELPVF